MSYSAINGALFSYPCSILAQSQFYDQNGHIEGKPTLTGTSRAMSCMRKEEVDQSQDTNDIDSRRIDDDYTEYEDDQR